MFRSYLSCAFFASSTWLGVGIADVARAQSTETAADLRISTQLSIDLNTPRNGEGGNSFGQVSAFFPLFQSSRRHLSFVTATGRVDTQGNLGGNVAVGHRLAIGDDTVLGGYLAYDLRELEDKTFNQIGLGAELKTTQWEAYINGYIPVGTTSFSTGAPASDRRVVSTQFKDNQLLLVTGGTQLLESALGSVDVGFGARLARFGAYGNLWGYGRVYYVDDSLGGSAQLDHRVSDRLRLGVGAQSDSIFGTQIFASIGSSLGRSRRQHRRTPSQTETGETTDKLGIAESAWQQIAASKLQRNSSILIRSEMRGIGRETQVATNPETGEAYRIRHVSPNANVTNQGNGSVESPFTTLGSDINDTDNTGLRSVESGELIYVQVGDSRTNPLSPFTVPLGVHVYSSAADITLPTQLGEVTLPSADSSVRPLVSALGNNGITLTGGNNRVSGFEIIEGANGVYANDVTGTVVIENNLIRNADDRALFVEQTTGKADLTIQQNQIETADIDGIRVNLTEDADLTLSITNNQISNIVDGDGDGIDIEANDTSTVALSIIENTINRAGNSAIELETCGDSTALSCNANFTARVLENDVSDSGGDSILLFHNSDQTAQITIENNEVRRSGIARTGVTQNVGNPLPVSGNGGFGIMAATFADGDLEISIINNTITDTQDEKIAILNNLSPTAAATLTAAAPSVIASIQSNTISGSGESIIANSDVSTISGSVPTPAPLNAVAVCLQLQDNVSENGYYLSNGLVATPNAPVSPITLASAGTFEQTVFSNNTGTLTTDGTLTFSTAPLNAFGPVSISSPGSTTGTCTAL